MSYANESSVGALLEMVERGCARLMIAGGGALSQEQPSTRGEGARDQQDERHICPLQLDVIERAVTLWTNPGDLVYSPFAGIGSEGWGSLKLGRKFVGSELKRSYFDHACMNLNNATAQELLALI